MEDTFMPGDAVFVPFVSGSGSREGIPLYFITEGTVVMHDDGKVVVKSKYGNYMNHPPGDVYKTMDGAAACVMRQLRKIAASIFDEANKVESKIERPVAAVGAGERVSNG